MVSAAAGGQPPVWQQSWRGNKHTHVAGTSIFAHRALSSLASVQGFQLGQLHAEAILDIVAQLALVPVKDPWPEAPAQASQAQELPDEASKHGLPAADILVRAISFRAGYGGMTGDMAMLRSFADIWRQRCVPCCFELYESIFA